MEPHGNDFKSYGPIGPVVNGRELVGFIKPTDEGAISAFAQAIRRTVEAQHVGPHGADLDFWWRHLSKVAPGLIVTGSFPSDPDCRSAHPTPGMGQTRGDPRSRLSGRNATTRTFLAEHAPDIVYHRVGVDDDGAPREDSWFFQGLAFARRRRQSRRRHAPRLLPDGRQPESVDGLPDPVGSGDPLR